MVFHEDLAIQQYYEQAIIYNITNCHFPHIPVEFVWLHKAGDQLGFPMMQNN